MEEWKDIEGYEGLYQVSSEGRIIGLKRGNIIKPIQHMNGYLFVNLHKSGSRTHASIHRLVAKAFITNNDNKPCVGHKNTIKTDNRAENLYWCTYEENNNHPLTKKRRSKTKKGIPPSEKTMKMLKEKISKRVYQYSKDGKLINVWNSVREASKNIGAFESNISACCMGKGRTCKGYKWSYEPL